MTASMRKTLHLFLSAVLAFAVFPLQARGASNVTAVKKNLKVLVLEGKPYERGLQHGKALKADIHALVDLWKADIERKYKIEGNVFIKKFLAYTDFPTAIKRWTPELLDEVRGIAEGVGNPCTGLAWSLRLWISPPFIMDFRFCSISKSPNQVYRQCYSPSRASSLQTA